MSQAPDLASVIMHTVVPIDATLVKVPLRCSSKQEAIAMLLDLLVARGLVSNREKVLAEILEREAASSTAIGYGAAIPHARSEFVTDTVCAFGSTLGAGIDFGTSPEPGADSRANLLFLMVSPRHDTTPHIKTLARIARLVKDEERRRNLTEATEINTILGLLGDLARS